MVVSISTVAVLRMAKHACQQSGTTVSGCLLGLDSEAGAIEVTNVFMHPAKGAADFQPQQQEDSTVSANSLEAAAATAAASFQTESVRLLKQANLDGNIVGWFQSSTLSSFVNEATVEIQFDYQTQNSNAILIVSDPAFETPLKAFRLTAAYMAFHKATRDRQNQGLATLITGGPVSFNTASMRVFEEVEINVSLSVLDEAFLFESKTSAAPSSQSANTTTAVQLLMETVEDLAIEKVRFSQLTAGKAPITTATRIRGEDEVKRLQSANFLILLTENVRRLTAHVEAAAKDNELICKIFESVRA